MFTFPLVFSPLLFAFTSTSMKIVIVIESTRLSVFINKCVYVSVACSKFESSLMRSRAFSTVESEYLLKFMCYSDTDDDKTKKNKIE